MKLSASTSPFAWPRNELSDSWNTSAVRRVAIIGGKSNVAFDRLSLAVALVNRCRYLNVWYVWRAVIISVLRTRRMPSEKMISDSVNLHHFVISSQYRYINRYTYPIFIFDLRLNNCVLSVLKMLLVNKLCTENILLSKKKKKT